jgi:hypothetical protein
MATATRTETLEPLPERDPDHAGLPVSDAAISDQTFSARSQERHRAGWRGAIQAMFPMV